MLIKPESVAFLCLLGVMQSWIVYLFFNRGDGALGVAFTMLFLTVDLYFIQVKPRK